MLKNLQKKKGIFKRIIIVLILFSFVFLPFRIEASTYAEKQQELDSLKKRMKEHRSLIEEKRKQAETLQNEIAILEAQIREAELALQATKIEISQTIEAITAQEKELIKQRNTLNESLRLMYEESETTLLETLLSSRSFSAVLDRIEYLTIVKNKIDEAIDKIEKIKKDLEEKKASLEILKTQQEAQAYFLNSQQKAKNELLAKTKGEEAAYQQLLADERSKANQVQGELAQMEAASRRGGGNYSGPPSPFGFSWPTRSHYVCCTYGNACYAGHTGIDIPGAAGTPIYAAADGVVEKTVSYVTGYVPGSYGNYILIRHSSGFRTRYAHLLYRGVLVSPGQSVSRGQQIGMMGGTGWSIPPGFVHLHFEILANDCIWGCDVNPLAYLP